MMKAEIPAPVAKHIEHFTGRIWLVPEILKWLEQSNERIFLLTGGPGTGKSMIQAWLAGYGPEPGNSEAQAQLGRMREQVAGAHFCQANATNLSPKDFADKIAKQLSANVPGFGDALKELLAELVQINVTQQVGIAQSGSNLTAVTIGRLDLGNMDDVSSFNRAFTQPIKKLYENGYAKPLLLLVDALDEALTYPGQTSLVELLAKLNDLPPQVRILATTRPDPRVKKLFRDARVLDLIEDAPDNNKDVQTYSAQRLVTVAPAFGADEREGLAVRISDAAHGVFLYAAMVLNDLGPRLAQDPALNPDDLELPKDLSGLYLDFLNRELGKDEDRWSESFKPLLGLIAVAQGEGLTQSQLATISGKEEVELPLRKCMQYLSGELPDGPFRLFHKSFADFLLEDEDNQDYHIAPEKMHKRIADYYWKTYQQDWSRCDDYGLNSLATHLDRGDQFERLAELINQAWMKTRFDRSGYTYDGFIVDVMLAWDHAHEETLRQIEAGQAPQAIADCVRYALIRTSINSLSANYDPAVVVRAVETGIWEPERALSVATMVPDAKARSAMFSAFLASGKLSGAQSAEAQRKGLEAARAIEYAHFRVEALADLAPHLTGDLFQQALREGIEALASARAPKDEVFQAKALARLAPFLTDDLALEAARAIEYGHFRADALVALAPRLTGDLLQQALQEVLEVAQASSDRGFLANTLVDLAPYLTGDLLQQALEAAQATPYKDFLPKALAALQKHLTGDLLQQALQEGLEGARSIEDEFWRARALAALAPQLTGDLLQQVLQEGLGSASWMMLVPIDVLQRYLPELLGLALATEEELSRASLLAALAPHLTGSLLEQAMDAAFSIKNEIFRTQALDAVVPQLTGELLQKWLPSARAVKSLDSGRFLAALVPQLTVDQLREELEAARTIEDDHLMRRDAVSTLMSQLTGDLLQQALQNGLKAACAIEEEYSRAGALADLAPYLTGDLLRQGLEAARAIKDEGCRVNALAGLAPQLTGDLLEQVLQQALEAAGAIKDEYFRATVLAGLVPHLTGDLLQHGLEAALVIDSEGRRAKVLAGLAPQLTGDLLRRGLEAARAINYEGDRVNVLAGLASQLTGNLLQQVLQEGLEAVRALDNDAKARGDALADLAPHLTGDLLQQGLEIARAIWKEDYRAWALASLARQLTGDQLQQGLEAALAIHSESFRRNVLVALAPQLTGDLLQQGLEAARTIKEGFYRVRVLAALAPQLTGDFLQQTLQEGLEAAGAIENEEDRASSLAVLLPFVPDQAKSVQQQIRQDMAGCIRNQLQREKREELLYHCWKKLYAPPLVDTAALAAIVRHINEVCTQWQWP